MTFDGLMWEFLGNIWVYLWCAFWIRIGWVQMQSLREMKARHDIVMKLLDNVQTIEQLDAVDKKHQEALNVCSFWGSIKLGLNPLLWTRKQLFGEWK